MKIKGKSSSETIEIICIISHFVVALLDLALFSYFEAKKQKAKLFKNIRCFSALLWCDISFKEGNY